ncbi:MAG: tetratricopeptide repeat protein [bacterium]
MTSTPAISPWRDYRLPWLWLPLLAYAPALTGDFVYDDKAITVAENPALRGEVSWLEILLTWDRPLREFTYMLDHAVWGFQPLGYHLQNLAWHAANVYMLYFFLLFLGVNRTIGFITALLFTAHPINTEAVAWISGRKELICLFFELAACYGFVYAVSRTATSTPLARLAHAGSLAALVLALLSKQVAVSLPFLMLVSGWLYFQTRRQPIPWRKLCKFLILPALITLAFLFYSYQIIERLDWVREEGTFYDPSARSAAYTPLSAVLTPCATLGHSVWLCLFPMDLTVEHAFSPVVTFWDSRWLLGAAAGVALTVLAWRTRGTAPEVLFGLVWMVVAWGPVSGLAPVSYLAADRYLYIPGAGFLLSAVALGDLLFRRGGEFPAKLPLAVVGIVAALFSIRTFDRCFDWRHEIALWQSAARARPGNPKVFFNLGNAYSGVNRMDEAFTSWNQTLALQPDYPQVWLNMGSAEEKRGDRAAAEKCYRKALEILPTYGTAHFNLGLLLEQQGRNEEALEHFTQAAEHLYGKRTAERWQGMAHYHIAHLLFLRGNKDLAAFHLARAEKLAPRYPPVYLLKGLLLQNNPAAARQEFLKALELEPRYSEAAFNVGVLEWQNGNRPLAEEYWKQAVEYDPGLAPQVEKVKKNAPLVPK